MSDFTAGTIANNTITWDNGTTWGNSTYVSYSSLPVQQSALVPQPAKPDPEKDWLRKRVREITEWA